jgi:hypothetical protein
LKGYAGKAGTFSKSTIPNAGNAVGYGNAGKSGTTAKSLIPNTGNADRYGDAGKAGKAGTIGKSPIMSLFQNSRKIEKTR